MNLQELQLNSHLKYDPQFRDRTFKSKKAFEKWLEKTSVATIQLVDNGQDLLEIKIDKYGEILDCNLQQRIWNGTIIALDKLEHRKEIWFLNTKLMCDNQTDFVVKNITFNS